MRDRPTNASRAAHRVLMRCHNARTPDGRVHLPLRDGTVAVGRLLGCTGLRVYLDTGSVAVERLETPFSGPRATRR